MIAAVVAALVFAATPAAAHVGSPNVFFEGNAGPHALSIVIRPPATLPGVAQVDIRAADGDLRAISLQPVFADAGAEGAPPPLPASRVAGDGVLWNGSFWLLRGGSYGVEVAVESERGGGRVTVPLMAAALAVPTLPPALAALLTALGALLAGGVVAIARAAAREAALPAGATPSAPERSRGRRAAGVAALLVALALYGGALRWQRADDVFANALARPVPVEATVVSEGARLLLRLTPGADLPSTYGWDTLVTDHGKLMHLFLLREPALDAFAHLHPVRRARRTFEGVLPPLPDGRYRIYAELTYENGSTETLVGEVRLPEPQGSAFQADEAIGSDVWCLSPAVSVADSATPIALDFDDSWHVRFGARADPAVPAGESPLMGGGRMRLETRGTLVVDEVTALEVVAVAPDGGPLELEPYMGMFGHAVVRRSDGGVFTHLHPVGTFSMAAAELLSRDARAPAPAPASEPPRAREVVFPYAFPSAGDYRIWIQVRTGGRVLTGVFDASVAPRG